jgi:hypothetical protein
MKYECTIYDRAEGKQHCTVEAESEDEADEQAGIVAAERGCSNVHEIVVGVFE